MATTGKGEAPTALTVRGFWLSNPLKEIDMRNLAKNELVFQGATLAATKRNGQIWFTATDIARALQYNSDDAVSRIFRRNQTEFSTGMSETVRLTVSGNCQKTVRIFSLRGAHLLAMFARTRVAKEFRRWVLDILDKESRPKAISIKGQLKVSCPCCGKSATVVDTVYLNRHRTEIIALCDKESCPNQLFKSEIVFSHYVEILETNGCMDGFVRSLSPQQKQQLALLLLRPA